ncbi:hypothetical protein SAMN05421805_11261 [Saccharopolyspora antimicrobica]|uniref:Uncharacterized protein n=1 Tax=Saccharopolyspora antimicrobica TaxID=455193 RepID=A0A1I5G1Z3_9PSEU|nr:hypothetical protein ATL45_2260 [Saccharopolyspora antimicrobica]SFO29988.1 hypothetical protein SAMN05421805_11261 [Saccharopolyspora antimicrobica]
MQPSHKKPPNVRLTPDATTTEKRGEADKGEVDKGEANQP